jgi:hypothetical protein
MVSLATDGRPEFLKLNNQYDLLYPVTWKEGDTEHLLETLQLRRLTGNEKIICEGPGTSTEKLARILSAMTGHMEVVLRKLDWADIDRLDDCIDFFTTPGPTTGPII